MLVRGEYMLKISLWSGAVAWTLMILRFTPLLGSGFESILYWFPPAMFGLVIGIIALCKGRPKWKAIAAICVNGVPIGFLIFLIYLLATANFRC